LENELADVGVLSFIPLQWDVQQPYTNSRHEEEHKADGDPRAAHGRRCNGL
jgi:hypothetical protein